MHSFPKTGTESCGNRIQNMNVYYIIPLNYRLTAHPENFKIKLYYFKERLSLRFNNLEVIVSVSYMFLAK